VSNINIFAVLKNVVAIFLVAALLVHTLGHVVVYFAYQTNIQYIAANICENRTKVESDCDGKCYLKKQLAEVDTQIAENDNPNNGTLPRVKIDKTDYFTDCTSLNLKQANCYLTIIQSNTSHYTFNYSSYLLRPPCNA
jgi:hypothetical protein